jgi:hypothetical protein
MWQPAVVLGREVNGKLMAKFQLCAVILLFNALTERAVGTPLLTFSDGDPKKCVRFTGQIGKGHPTVDSIALPFKLRS